MKEDGGGATWAFEVGSKSMVCPIVVEDINPPRIFQVEVTMLPKGIKETIYGLGFDLIRSLL